MPCQYTLFEDEMSDFGVGVEFEDEMSDFGVGVELHLPIGEQYTFINTEDEMSDFPEGKDDQKNRFQLDQICLIVGRRYQKLG